jgi:biopolymer transport protein ExbD
MQVGLNKTAAVINVTPMIDILLVMIIVFMLLPTKTVGLKSDVPQLPTENQPSVPNPQHLVLRIQRDRSMEINSQPILLAELQDRLRTLFAARPDGVLFVDGDGSLNSRM